MSFVAIAAAIETQCLPLGDVGMMERGYDRAIEELKLGRREDERVA